MYLYVTLSTGSIVKCKINSIEEIKTILNDQGSYIQLKTMNETTICVNKNAIVCLEFSDRPLPM